ncbi:MAG: nucleotidyltransferase family protein [Candidatus Bathyarchaeota archaeon]|nr:nucleotidyltransferase family protein [Candidatus Bathyarchaeota archaeon]MDH5712943.1 nucleotidyltransferase family protein [Candidatus Bathyarchaeota archaeon]
MTKVKALVLCGGPGVRLRPITYYFQKTMLPIGSKQKPLLEYVIRLLKFHGVEDLALLVDYKAEQIQNYFDDGSRFNVKISYVHDDPKLKGTAGSLLNAYKHGVVNVNDTLLTYYGDILTNINIKDLLSYHQNRRATATVALASGFTVRVGLADVEDSGKIRGFVEKPTLEKPVSIGILVFNGETLKEVDRLKMSQRGLDLMGNVIPRLIKAGRPVYGYLTDAFWYDVGSTEAYEKLNHKLVDKMFSHLFQ